MIREARPSEVSKVPHHMQAGWRMFVSTYKGKIVARAVLSDDGWVYGVWTDEEHRGKGHATKVVSRIIQEADRDLFLHVRSYNHVAQHLYQKLGFVTYDDDGNLHCMKREVKNG